MFFSKPKQKKEQDSNGWDKKRLFIESTVALLCVLLGNIWGKSSNVYYYNGQKMSENDLNNIMQENSELKNERDNLALDNKELSIELSNLTIKKDSLQKENEKYYIENQKLENENRELKTEVSSNPIIEYKNLGLSVDGEEVLINTDKSSVFINQKQYFSKDILDGLFLENQSINVRDNMVYIGKIVKEKASLFDMPLIQKTNYASIIENKKDTYGNMHTKSVYFSHGNHNITFNAGKQYSNLKCTLGVLQDLNGGGIVEIESENGVIYTSDELINTIEPYEIDIPINFASRITIKYIGSLSDSGAIVTDAILYNKE